jgi:DNA-binding MarR family transcriptional regulator
MQHVFFVTGEDMTKNLTQNVDFSKSVFYKITQLSIYLETLSKNFFDIRNIDLTHDEFSALNFILNYPDICQRDLAKMMLRDRVRTGRILTSLENKGYIKRVSDMKNNRLVRRLQITKSGQRIYSEQFAIMSQIMDKLLEKFSQEQMDELKMSLSKLETAVSEIVEFNI